MATEDDGKAPASGKGATAPEPAPEHQTATSTSPVQPSSATAAVHEAGLPEEGNENVTSTSTEPVVETQDVQPGPIAAGPATATPTQVSASDTDSAYGDDEGSEIHYGSVSSSIYNYRMENGRTYHAYSDGKYFVPNDEQEQERMDLVYHAILLMFDGKPFFAPVENPQRIVDMGTGTGIWALDVGDEYPEAQVVGIDLSPIQPKWVSPNVEFRIDDIDQPWVFEQPLDLVHSRLCMGNAIRSWPRYFAEAYRCLRPGGWVETQDFDLVPQSDDNSFPENSMILQWHDLFHKGMLIGGCNMHCSAEEVKGHMRDAGFINVEAVEMKLPMSPWNKEDKKLKEAGSFTMVSMMDDLSGMSLAVFTRLLGWERTELEVFLAHVRREWKSKGIHGYWPLFALYGQKPPESES